MYNTAASAPTTTTDPAAAAAVLGIALAGVLISILFFAIPLLVAEWKLFEKAGKPGWAAIVPFYNFWVMKEIGGIEDWKFWVFLGGSLAGAIPFFGIIFSIVALVMEIMIIIGFAKRFDRDAGFWVLLYLLPIVGVFMVNKANYIGTASVDAPPAVPPVAPVAPTPPAPTA